MIGYLRYHLLQDVRYGSHCPSPISDKSCLVHNSETVVVRLIQAHHAKSLTMIVICAYYEINSLYSLFPMRYTQLNTHSDSQ